jgi:hypothetical protein
MTDRPEPALGVVCAGPELPPTSGDCRSSESRSRRRTDASGVLPDHNSLIRLAARCSPSNTTSGAKAAATSAWTSGRSRATLLPDTPNQEVSQPQTATPISA